MVLRVSIFLTAVVAGLGITVLGQSRSDANYIYTTVPFLTIAPDSRAGAMGDAGVSTKPDIYSQYWNASKYAFIKNDMGAAVSIVPWLRNIVDDINLAYLNYYLRLDQQQVLSASLLYFSLGRIIYTQEFSADPAGFGQPNEFNVDVAYTRLFSENFSSALTMRFIRSDIGHGASVGNLQFNPGISFAADLSSYYQKDIEINNGPGEFAWGIQLSNLGSKISYSDGTDKQFIPAKLRTGARVTMELDDYNNLSFTSDLSKLLVPTRQKRVVENGDTTYVGRPTPNSLPMSWIQSFYDAPGGLSEELQEWMVSVGAEYWYMNQFAIRAGYFYEHRNKGNRKFFTAGVGLRLNALSFDFSYLFPASARNSPLANTMRLSLGLNFGN